MTQTETVTPIGQTLSLVRSAQDGDSSAMNSLFERFSDRVLRIVRLRMGKQLRRRYESQDLFQEAMLAAVKNFDGFDVQTNARFVNWLAKIAQNEVFGKLRREGADKRDMEREVSLDAPPSSESGKGLAAVAKDDSALAGIIQSEDAARVEECIAELPEHYREVIVLWHYAEMSWHEIAEEVQRPTAAAARVHYARAMAELRDLVRQHEASS